MEKCLIVSGGEYAPIPENLQYDTVIACDKGYEYCVKMGISPDLLLGDFDSYKGTLPEDVLRLTYPVEKDDTDTMLAIKYALDAGAKEIILSCALGKRFDHALANIQSLAYIASHEAKGILVGNGEWMETFTGGTLILPKKEHTSLSLFSLTDTCDNLTIRGTKYEVENEILQADFPLGVSNKWAASEAVITMDSGILLVVESDMSGE